MKRYTAAQARAQLAAILDAAEKGEDVVIERRGRRFTVSVSRSGQRRSPHAVRSIEIVDSAVAEGQWTWSGSGTGLRFSKRRGPR